MAQTPEGKVKAATKKVLKDYGIWFFCPMQNGMGVVGIPDFICCYEGVFFAIETKAPGKINNLSPNQEQRIAEIRFAQGIAIVIDDAQQLKDLLTGAAVMQQLSNSAGTTLSLRDALALYQTSVGTDETRTSHAADAFHYVTQPVNVYTSIGCDIPEDSWQPTTLIEQK